LLENLTTAETATIKQMLEDDGVQGFLGKP